jgi:tripartite-type tricarboxylate transporter receptor subunit TctC
MESPGQISAEINSLGMPIFDMGIWMGFLAPTGTPKEIVDQLSSDIRAAVASGELQKRMGAAGAEYELLSTTPDDFKKFIQAEIPKWNKVIQEVGLPKS